MYDHEDDAYSEQKLPPSNVMWETVLTFQRRSIFFDILYYESDSPFLDYAPSYAACHRMDPQPLVQWHIKSLMFFRSIEGCDYIFVNIKAPQFTDLETILEAINNIDFHGVKMQLSLKLPQDTTGSIALLLPDNIFELSTSLPSNGVIDSAVIPAFIRALPNLEYLYVYINVSTHSFEPFNSCTTAKYSFRPLPTSQKYLRAHLKISRSQDPVWQLDIWNIPRRKSYIEYDPGINMVLFEREVVEWFQQSASLKMLEVCFEPEDGATIPNSWD